ncbi:ankyrin repeat domain-containing protein [Longimicrobium terrae]|uniref:Ankyrin repeat protein n=1 Tax=Longimicrobium terrae TaxID=1639882 RepID=A0A841H2H5_9BACT|nr:ankyrin repeat domain-containing protein [Longimicrobium terrae]MBB4637925.1 ankyrin repeat protein [Longimicrobium terrae]MBB6072172.1 ankyrin repeat protein [Longimicrobium terrae]NNC28401.1 ankyrin repeat domain-containing protein [Longimicrobium terrae]
MAGMVEVMEAVNGGDADALAALLERDPAAAGLVGDEGASPLLNALYRGRRDLAELFVRHGRELDGWEAAAMGDEDRLRAHLEADSDLPGRRTHDGWTPLHLSAFFGQQGTMRLLLERGADPNAVSENWMRNTPLHAALNGPLAAHGIAALIRAGADPNARQKGGFGPLHSAANRGDVAIMGVLLAAEADPNAAADDGRTPLDFARTAERDEAVRYLLAHGAEE